jgi:UDP-N-acetylmuramate--alanine ligase
MKPLFGKLRHIHFVGIGGVGMSGIAEVLLNLGHRVSGSDIVESEATRRLADLGAAIHLGHNAAVVTEDVDVVVMSSAARTANPEVLRARELRVPVIPRAEMLAELMRMKTGIAVAGTHGKTTTTSLIATVLHHAGFDPTAVIGGRLLAFGSNAQLGRSDLMVAEADESDGTFLLLSPTIAVVTNVEREHLDHYKDADAIRNAFVEFINGVPFFGVAVVCLDDLVIRGMLPLLRKPVITYGVSPEADYVVRDVHVTGMSTRLTVEHQGEMLAELRVPMPGRHQALNAVAALAVARHVGVELAQVREALAGFGGIHRRFEVCGEVDGVTVVSDYAHHPTEIRATVEAAREGFDRRIVVAFQPHRFTRLRDLFDDFLGAFDAADRVVVTEVYAAGESPVEGATGEALHAALRRRGHLDVAFAADEEALLAALADDVRAGDLVLVLGAGSIYRLAPRLVEVLRSRSHPVAEAG